MTDILNLNHVSFRQDDFQLLSEIEFSLTKGKIIGLLGVNGAGKSTTLKIVAGLLQPDTGRVYQKSNSTVGYVPETPPLIPEWSVKKFLSHVCRLHEIPYAQHNQRIKNVSNCCELDKIINKKCAVLSKGNQQRVNIAQALLHNPDILILDEPTSGLDPQQTHQFREVLQTLKANTAIILSSHIMQEITTLCDTVIVIHNGKQIGTLNLSERNNRILIEFTKPVSTETFQTLSAWQEGNKTKHQFEINKQTDRNSILAFCLSHQLPIHRVVGIEELAEREFLSLIGRDATHD